MPTTLSRRCGWTLAQLRRALGVPNALRANPLELGLPAGAVVDVLARASGDPAPGLARGELLESVDPGAGTVFDAWLLVERRRLAGVCEAVVRDTAMRALASGAALDASALASRALAANEFDETIHELLVRCLARAGEVGAARHHANVCEVLFPPGTGPCGRSAGAARGPRPWSGRRAGRE